MPRFEVWKCHQYDCNNMSGNVISLISLALGGSARPRGKDFVEAAKQVFAEGLAQFPTNRVLRERLQAMN